MICVVISEYNAVKLEINTEKIKPILLKINNQTCILPIYLWFKEETVIENLKYLHLYIRIVECS